MHMLVVLAALIFVAVTPYLNVTPYDGGDIAALLQDDDASAGGDGEEQA